MNRHSRCIALFIACFVGTQKSWASDQMTVAGADRTITVRFEPPAPDVWADPAKPRPTAGLKFRRYSINFYENNRRPPLATTQFIDFFGADGRPTPVEDLLAKILWSPKKDFAVLPKEGWPDSKGPVWRQAISLNTSFPWQTAEFRLDDSPLVWEDTLRVAGHRRDGCRISVAEFDGAKGKINGLLSGASPIGYELGPADANKMVIRKVLDGCATPADRARFVPECVALDFRFQRREIVRCP